MLIDKIKEIPPEEREKQANIIKSLISLVLYFVILNNPAKAGLIKFIMKIMGIAETEFDEMSDDEIIT